MTVTLHYFTDHAEIGLYKYPGVAETTAMVTPFNSDREFYRWAEENVHPGWTVMYRVWDHANNHLSTPTPNNTARDLYNAIDWPAAPPSPPVPHSRILLIEKKAKKYLPRQVDSLRDWCNRLFVCALPVESSHHHSSQQRMKAV
eukprot:TRINITY_DN26209_c0_g1_i1.p1 TRINITY_DN26209_c0_g1~~TRINITY_DN26209_c0_g1_i1.p1  ORF type:complete len:144 (-),score=4.67 TRINITY_DN26209_c0_g1_i1:413-844(-)